MVSSSFSTRNLSKTDLGGVIFGCTQSTMRECLVSQLFGLPGQHILYVQNVRPGLPLFLFNYTDRKLYGIFEAESHGKLNINPYGWSSNGSERTKFPAQVRIQTRIKCEPLLEKQFKPIIADNYFTSSRFCFELDRYQASALISLFAPSPVVLSGVAPSPVVLSGVAPSPVLSGVAKWVQKVAPELDAAREEKNLTPSTSEADRICLNQSDMKPVIASDTPLSEQNQVSEIHSDKEEVENEEQIIYRKLKKLASECQHGSSSGTDHVADTLVPCTTNAENAEDIGAPEIQSSAANKCEEPSTSDLHLVIAQLEQGIKELKDLSQEHIQKTTVLEKKMAESELELCRVKGRLKLLELRLEISTSTCVTGTMTESFDELCLSGGDQRIFLLGGYDGYKWLSALDCYSPSHDTVRSLQPMITIRSHAAAAVLNGHIFIFGGKDGDMWYDTVESYSLSRNEWTPCPPLNVEKGNLAGATLHGKLFAIGGGNSNCLSDVEMFDPFHPQWVRIQSMLEKRFAPASAVLNGAVYAVGGYDGKNYLRSAERFDPRAMSWQCIPSMNTSRGGHSLVAFKEKLYAIGGYDGIRTVPSLEVFDPRFGSWTYSDLMNEPRGYAGVVVIGESIYAIGGVQTGPNFVDTVERYQERTGWLLTNSTAIGKRSFFSAVVL